MTPGHSERIRGMYQRFKQMMAIFGRRNFYKMLATTLAVVTLVTRVWILEYGHDERSALSDGTFVSSYVEEPFWKKLFGAPKQVMTITDEVHVLNCVANTIAAVLMLFGVIIMMAIFGRRNLYKMLATTLAVVTLVKSVQILVYGPDEWSVLSDGTFVRSYVEEPFRKILFGAPKQVMTITDEVHVPNCVAKIIAAVLMLFGVIRDKEVCLWPGLVLAVVDLGQDVYDAATITPLIRYHVGDTPARVFLAVLNIIMTIETGLVYACLKLVLILRNENGPEIVNFPNQPRETHITTI
jgi:hypothetical protein